MPAELIAFSSNSSARRMQRPMKCLMVIEILMIKTSMPPEKKLLNSLMHRTMLFRRLKVSIVSALLIMVCLHNLLKKTNNQNTTSDLFRSLEDLFFLLERVFKGFLYILCESLYESEIATFTYRQLS